MNKNADTCVDINNSNILQIIAVGQISLTGINHLKAPPHVRMYQTQAFEKGKGLVGRVQVLSPLLKTTTEFDCAKQVYVCVNVCKHLCMYVCA